MNWLVKFIYQFNGNQIPKDVPLEVKESIITDDLTKVKFPRIDTDFQFQGFDYRLVSIEITITHYKILV